MKCQKCKTNDACVFYTQNINGIKKEAHLCNECAKQLNLVEDFSNEFDFGFDRMFSNFFDGFGNIGVLELPRISLFTGRDCFANDCCDGENVELDNALKNITNKNKNISPKQKLEKELQDCIKKENYERAAEIRDELKKYKDS